MKSAVRVSFLTALLVGIGLSNLFSPVRDGSFTLDMPTYETARVLNENLFTEAPNQIIHTQLRNVMDLTNYRYNGEDLFFVERFVNTYGEARLSSTNDEELVDARELLSEEDLEAVRDWSEVFAFDYLHPCPDSSETCKYSIGWNRDRDGGAWLFGVFIIDENHFLIVDDSILGFQ